MTNQDSIDVLNSLVVINNDRIEGYKTASEETEDMDLKALFSGFISTSTLCKSELINEIRNLGGTPDEGTRASGKLYRVWMDLKAAITGKDRKTILDSCEYGEDVAVEAYQDAIDNHANDLAMQHQTLLNTQYMRIKSDHDKVKSLRDELVEHDA